MGLTRTTGIKEPNGVHEPDELWVAFVCLNDRFWAIHGERVNNFTLFTTYLKSNHYFGE